MTALLLLAHFAQTPALPYVGIIEDQRRLAAFSSAQEALGKDRALLDYHRGLTAFLEAEPTLYLTETAYQEQLRLPTFRTVTSAFEEALRARPEDRRFFDRYQEALNSDPGLRRQFDTLHRIEMRERRTDRAFGEAVRYLKTHPSDALIFLNNPLRLLPTPEALYALRNRFRRDRDLQEELLSFFEELDQTAAAHAYVFPWWAAAFDEDTELGAAHGQQHTYLLGYPQRFWVLNRHDAEWAGRATGERQWIDHFYALIRRDSLLRDTYFDYLATLRDYPDLKDAMARRWAEELGPPAGWPPDDAPPELPRWNADESIQRPREPGRPTRESILPKRPERPSASDVRVPSRPKRPQPVKPVVPEPQPPSERDGTVP